MATSGCPRVLHISTEKTYRGGERQLVWLHEGLASQNWESHLICRRDGELAERDVENSTGFPWNGSHDIGGFIHALRLCHSISPDLIHCHDSHAHNIGSLLRVMRGIPVVVTRRVVFPIRDTRFNRWRFGHVDQIIAISKAVARECQQMAPMIPISVVPDGVKWGNRGKGRDYLRSELGLEPSQVVLGTVGFFTEEKNFDLILQAADHLGSHRPEAVLLCIGPLSSALQVQAKERPNIRLTGRVPNASDYYPAFDLYISSSTQEGLGSSLLDAVVRDIPVVAVDSIGGRDIFGNDNALIAADQPKVFLQEVEEVVKSLTEARRRAEVRGDRARKQFSVYGMIAKNVSVYDHLVGIHCDTLHDNEFSGEN